MGALTKKERESLEDVFLSIQSHSDKYNRLKELSSLIMIKNTHINPLTLLKRARNRVKETKLLTFLLKLSKKKKSLSK